MNANANKVIVFDTSALLTFFLDEEGADTLQELLKQAKHKRIRGLVSFVTMSEIYYRIFRSEGEDAAKEVLASINALPLSVVHSNDRLSLVAGRLKANHQLSLADAYIAATALVCEASLVHKDPEFDGLKSIISMVVLPYKPLKSQ